MSEAGLIIGLISGTIQIIGATKQVYDAAKDAKGQPTSFREVAARLPLVVNILHLAREKMENEPVDEQVSMAIEYVVKACEEKALRLKMTLEKCLPTTEDGFGARIWKGLQTVPRGNRVETLMQGILKDIVIIAGDHGLRVATEEQIKELSKAITAMGDLAPSACEEISSVTNSSYGGGAIYSNTGTAPQQINNGRGNFYNNNVHGSVQTMFGDNINLSIFKFKNTNNYQAVQAGTLTDQGNNPTGMDKIEYDPHQESQDQLDGPYLKCCVDLRAISSDSREDRQELIIRKGPLSKVTCEWIFKNPAFHLWLSRPSSQRLWIPGKPGKGKTVLAIVLAEYLEFQEIDENCILLEYYFNSTDTTRNNATGILRALILLILIQRPAMFKYIPELKVFPVAKWPFKTLCRIFQNMVGDPGVGKIFFLLDALDECTEGREDLICILRMFGSSRGYSANEVHLLTLSRHHPTNIALEFSSDPTIDLDNELALAEEVESFISYRIDVQYPSRNLQDTWPSKLKEELIRKADKTFLWAGFALKELKRVGSNRIKSERALANLPMGLNALYERILLQIEEPDRVIAAKILECLVIAYRPLTVPELAATLPMDEIPCRGLNKFDAVLDHLNSCGSILEVKPAALTSTRVWKNTRMRRSGERGPKRKKMVALQPGRRSKTRHNTFTIRESPWHWQEVRLVHGSAKDYLLNVCSSAQKPRAELRFFSIDKEQAHMKLVQCCLGTSTLDFPESIPRTWYQGPLARYSIGTLKYHARVLAELGRTTQAATIMSALRFLEKFHTDSRILKICNQCGLRYKYEEAEVGHPKCNRRHVADY